MMLIDKDALVAEIERWLGEIDRGFPNDHNLGRFDAYKRMLSLINTLEVREVDLEKSISDWLFEGLPNDEELIDYIKETAKHFFELGLKARQ